jgi:hypothetical protein
VVAHGLAHLRHDEIDHPITKNLACTVACRHLGEAEEAGKRPCAVVLKVDSKVCRLLLERLDEREQTCPGVDEGESRVGKACWRDGRARLGREKRSRVHRVKQLVRVRVRGHIAVSGLAPFRAAARGVRVDGLGRLDDRDVLLWCGGDIVDRDLGVVLDEARRRRARVNAELCRREVVDLGWREEELRLGNLSVDERLRQATRLGSSGSGPR